MKYVSRVTFGAMVLAGSGLLGAALLQAQAGAPPAGGAAAQPMLAGKVFKNVTAMKDIPVDQFMQTMGIFSSSLGNLVSLAGVVGALAGAA